jgi:hypothetical protein
MACLRWLVLIAIAASIAAHTASQGRAATPATGGGRASPKAHGSSGSTGPPCDLPSICEGIHGMGKAASPWLADRRVESEGHGRCIRRRLA